MTMGEPEMSLIAKNVALRPSDIDIFTITHYTLGGNLPLLVAAEGMLTVCTSHEPLSFPVR